MTEKTSGYQNWVSPLPSTSNSPPSMDNCKQLDKGSREQSTKRGEGLSTKEKLKNNFFINL